MSMACIDHTYIKFGLGFEHELLKPGLSTAALARDGNISEAMIHGAPNLSLHPHCKGGTSATTSGKIATAFATKTGTTRDQAFDRLFRVTE